MKKHRSIKSHIAGRLYTIANRLPRSTARHGRRYQKLRERIARGFIAYCGHNVNLEPHIYFDLALKIDDYSGIGEHSGLFLYWIYSIYAGGIGNFHWIFNNL